MVLAALLLSLIGPVAADSVFYQPQRRDAELSPQQWHTIVERLQAAGHETLVIQYTHVDGESLLDGDKAWLQHVIDAARGEGLQVWLGLLMPSGYFDAMGEQGDPDYFTAALLRNADWQDTLREAGALDDISGIYLPMELSDRFGSELQRRQRLSRVLAEYASHSQQAVAISAYATGDMAPNTFADWMEDLAEAGLDVWVQDGFGAGLLEPIAQGLYLDALRCERAIILEHFRRDSADEQAFSATPADSKGVAERREALACHPKMLFSLRYLPAADGLLQHD